jgi:hypothetical protein
VLGSHLFTAGACRPLRKATRAAHPRHPPPPTTLSPMLGSHSSRAVVRSAGITTSAQPQALYRQMCIQCGPAERRRGAQVGRRQCSTPEV